MDFKKISIIATAIASSISVIGFGVMMGGGYKEVNYGRGAAGVGPFNWHPEVAMPPHPDLQKGYWEFYNDAKKNPSIASQYPFFLDIKTAGDMTIAGSVVFSLFAILAIGSGVCWFIFSKKQ